MNWSDFVSAFLAIYFSMIALTYSIRLQFKEKRQKTFLGNPWSTQWIGQILFRFFRVAIWLICVVRVFAPGIDQYLVLLPWHDHKLLNLTGMTLLLAGAFLVFMAHRSLGPSWSSGINEAADQRLIIDKMYRHTRNPIFLGVILCQFGFAFALPSVFSMLCLLLGVASIVAQVHVEENHLAGRFGDSYNTYRQHTPRWFRLPFH